MTSRIDEFGNVILDQYQRTYVDLVLPAVTRFCREQEAKGMRTWMGVALAAPSLLTEIMIEDGKDRRSCVKMECTYPGLMVVTAGRVGVIMRVPQVSLLEMDWSIDALANAFRTVAAELGGTGSDVP